MILQVHLEAAAVAEAMLVTAGLAAQLLTLKRVVLEALAV